MEIRINKEIRNYKETIFFGLSMRQFVCSAVAIALAVLCYICFYRVLGKELVSWLCMLVAAPVAAAGFFHYNGMTLELFLWAWIKTEILFAGNRVWKAENQYALLLEAENSESKRKNYIKKWRVGKERSQA